MKFLLARQHRAGPGAAQQGETLILFVGAQQNLSQHRAAFADQRWPALHPGAHLAVVISCAVAEQPFGVASQRAAPRPVRVLVDEPRDLGESAGAPFAKKEPLDDSCGQTIVAPAGQGPRPAPVLFFDRLQGIAIEDAVFGSQRKLGDLGTGVAACFLRHGRRNVGQRGQRTGKGKDEERRDSQWRARPARARSFGRFGRQEWLPIAAPAPRHSEYRP